MTAIRFIHIASGVIALLLGAVAASTRKGGRVHVSAGTWFCVAMFVLGVSASILEPFRMPKPGSPVGGMMVCYFVATAWMTARRRDGMAGLFEKVACGLMFALAAAIIVDGFKRAFAAPGEYPVPPTPGVVIVLGVLCLLAALGDLRVIRGRLSDVQRISRHLWRMCFAFFIATGSFFLGQQKFLPPLVRDTALQFILAFAPFALMLFWLVRVRLSKAGPVRRQPVVSVEG
jgi:uncharacterized membrane protein